MRILALDTTLNACSAAIGLCEQDRGCKLLAHRTLALQRGHAEALVPMIAELTRDAQIRLPELDLVGITTGPGSFTGVRVGVSAARALALAAGCPTCSVTSLHLLALSYAASKEAKTSAPAPARLMVTADARRNQIYWQSFTRTAGQDYWMPALDAQISSPTAALARWQSLPALPTLVIGNGMERLKASDQFEQFQTAMANAPEDWQLDETRILPAAADLLPVIPHLPKDETIARPLYLRAADAKPQVPLLSPLPAKKPL